MSHGSNTPPSQPSIQDAVKLHQAGHLTEAILLYQKILEQFPNDCDALNLLGVAKVQMKDSENGIVLIEKALMLNPDCAEAHNNLANALAEMGRYEEAIPHFERATSLKPNYIEAYHNWGRVLKILQRYDHALLCYQKVIALKPDSAEIYNSVGIILKQLKRHKEAIACYQKAIELQPNFSASYSNLGNIFVFLNRCEEALFYFKKAIELNPDFAEAYNNCATALQGLNRHEESLAYYEKALLYRDDYFDALYGKALACLALGYFEEGWSIHEKRWKRSESEPFPMVDLPLWQGEDLFQKNILIVSEQGSGDQLQMLRYIPLLEAMGAMCWVKTTNSLKTLAARSFHHARVITSLDNIQGVDYWVCMLSLPFMLKTFNEGKIPQGCPYLVPDSQKIKHWQEQFSDIRELKVGVVWRGNAKHTNDHNRSISLETLLPLFLNKKIQFMLLQKDITESERSQVGSFDNVSVFYKELKNFDDTAAAVMALDLVIVVDTAVAHLAGALNKKVWILLPFSADWRWLVNRSDSPWYPSAQLIRQKYIGHWDEVVLEVGHALKKEVKWHES